MAEPIHGPINIGIKTVIKILIPWNNPTLSAGVWSRIEALKQAEIDAKDKEKVDTETLELEVFDCTKKVDEIRKNINRF